MPKDNVVSEIVALALGLAAGTVIALVWLGAMFSALVFGTHQTLGVGPKAAATALPHLFEDAGAPAKAWPPPAFQRLPGPVACWASTGLVAVVVLPLAVAVVLAVTRRRQSVGLARRRRMGLDPELRFAKAADVAPLWVKGPTPNRVILGRVGRHLVATEDRRAELMVPRWRRRRAGERRGDRGAVVVLGPTRCGKTTALAVPAILEWQGPVVALSVKSDLMGSTLRARRRVGEVKVFDPADATRQTTCAWSPLRGSQTLSGAKKAARALANATDWSASSTGDMAFWVAGAEDLLAPLLFVAAACDMGMGSVVSWVLSMDRPEHPDAECTVSALAKTLAQNRNARAVADASAALEMLTATWGLEFRQLSSVYVTAKAMISPWQDPTVLQSTRGTPVDLEWLLDARDLNGAPRANTLYLCAPLHEAKRLAPVLGGLLGDLLGQAYERVGKNNKPLRTVLVIVDEAGNWPLTNLPELASTCAGIGIQLVLVYQSKAQIDASYRDESDTVIANCLTKVFFAGLSDESTLRYAEGLLGAEHVIAQQRTIDVGRLGGGMSVTESAVGTELLPMALLRQVRPGEALLVHNTLPPAHLLGRYWFRDPSLRALAAGRPRRRARQALAVGRGR